MKLSHAFHRLPLRFDAERLETEIAALGPSVWRPHPQGHRGNDSVPLVARDGAEAREETRGCMRPTSALARCPYMMQVFAALDAPIGRSRLMRIAGQAEATLHVDLNYYWSDHVRVHIPVTTYEGVRFLCGDEETFMPAGECFVFDTWRPHNVLNPDDRPRTHLVIDTVGSPTFFEAMLSDAAPRFVAFSGDSAVTFALESTNFPVVMAPAELARVTQIVCDDIARTSRSNTEDATALVREITRLRHGYRALYAELGDRPASFAPYRTLLDAFAVGIARYKRAVLLPNGVDAVTALEHYVIAAAINPELDAASPVPRRPDATAPATLDEVPSPRVEIATPAPRDEARIVQPVFIVSAPRSGSTFLFEALARSAGFVTIGGESHGLIEGVEGLSPSDRDFASNRLEAADATPERIRTLREGFARFARDDAGRPVTEGPLRLLEKTPKNALRIPFLRAVFPDARFVYLHREPKSAIASIIEGWGSGRFVTYRNLPRTSHPWSFLLVDGWRSLIDAPVATIAAAQWEIANRSILDALDEVPESHVCVVSYEKLVESPHAELARLAAFAGVTFSRERARPETLSRHTLTAPNKEKWRAHEVELERVLPSIEPTVVRARQVVERARLGVAKAPVNLAANPLRSVHTGSFPELLRGLGASVFVSTYQAGKLVILREDRGTLNTHFRTMPKPMGLALAGGKLAVGTETEVRTFGNVAATASRLAPQGRHDAAFLPREVHVTGDIQIHDVAYGDEGLWCVNTRFSCLCTLDRDHSFVPRYRPRFIDALAPEDRCHLNGLAMIDGTPRFVTALGTSNVARGWRDDKRAGGVVIDVARDEVIVRGLSMPHSPRFHDGKLYVLDSGNGGLGCIDLVRGRYEECIRLPGFTRGLAFHGRYAFVGLSQVRESAVFSGIAIADEPLERRACGIWVVDLVANKVVAFTRFEEGVQEIFAIEVARGMRFPDVVTDDPSIVAGAFVLPDAALRAVPESFRTTDPAHRGESRT